MVARTACLALVGLTCLHPLAAASPKPVPAVECRPRGGLPHDPVGE